MNKGRSENECNRGSAKRTRVAVNQTEYLAALRAAAQRKGAPLSAEEIANIGKLPDRAALAKRFHNVVMLAGYPASYADKVVAEYLDSYMQDMPQFLAKMQQYEDDYKRDGEII